MELLNHRKQRRNAGFTLVEVVVVLVILAILAAILIPAMTGWIDKSQAKVCAYNRGQLQRYYTYEKSLYYQDGVTVSLADVLAGKYKETADDVAAAKCPSKGVYSANGETVTCSIHGDGGGQSAASGLVYGGSTGTAPDKYLSEALQKGDNGNPLFPDGTHNVDSTAPDGSNFTPYIKTYLAANGLDLSAQNVQSWAIRPESKTVNGQRVSYSTFYWTDQSVADASPGSSVRVIRYNPNTGNYTAGYMLVTAPSGKSYHTLADTVSGSGNWVEYAGQSAATKSSYEETLKVFNAMPLAQP